MFLISSRQSRPPIIMIEAAPESVVMNLIEITVTAAGAMPLLFIPTSAIQRGEIWDDSSIVVTN